MNDTRWLNRALASMHNGQWFGWKKNYTGTERMAYENLIVHDNSITKPTDEQLASYETAGNEAETAQAVLNKRASEYKELKEQLDLLYHDMTAGKGDKTGEWYKHIKAVKDANPKG